MQKLFKVHLIPLFEDNYSYLVLGKNREQGLLVDPAEVINNLNNL